MARMGRVRRIAIAACWVPILLGAGVVDAVAHVPRVRVGSAAVLPRGARTLGPVPATHGLRLTIALTPQDPAALQAYATAVSTPGSPQFHHYLTVRQFSQRFGAPAAQIAAVRAALQSQGLTVGAPSASALTLPVTGSVADLQRAFSVTESQVQLPSGRTAYANLQAPQLDANVAGAVQAVIGLDDVAVAQPQDLPRQAAPRSADAAGGSIAGVGPSVSGAAGATSTVTERCSYARTVANNQAAAGYGAYTADDIGSAYGLNSFTNQGAGQTVALFEEEPYQAWDVTQYGDCYGYGGTLTLTPVSYDGTTPPAYCGPSTVNPDQDCNDDSEAALDIEQIMGLAPKANIDVFQAPANTPAEVVLNAIATASPLAQVVSSSWGVCEAFTPASVMAAENTTLQEMAIQGQTFVVASGDMGSTDCAQSSNNVNRSLSVVDPGGQPWATAVGGTSLGTYSAGQWNTPTDGSYPSEYAWNDPPDNAGSNPQHQGSGGGVSAWAPMAAYQADATPGLGVIGPNSVRSAACGGYCRQVPDVSADADSDTGYTMLVNSVQTSSDPNTKWHWEVIGGTSASAPLWAAFIALANASPACQAAPPPRQLGFINPALYELAGGASYATYFNDVTQSNPLAPGLGNDVFGGANPANAGKLYPVSAGYDMVTGLGTPKAAALGAALCAQLANPPRITVTDPGDQTGTAGTAIAPVTVTATDSAGDTPTFSATGLPAGLSIGPGAAPGTAQISGTPTTAQTVTVTVTATDSATRSSAIFTWTIGPGAQTTTTASSTASTTGGTPTAPPPPPTTTATTTTTTTTTTTSAPTVKPGRPSTSSVVLSGLARRRPRLTFTVSAGSGAPGVRSVTVSLPSGIAFARSARTLARGVVVRAGGRRLGFRVSLRHGILTILLSGPTARAQVAIAAPAMAVTAAEAARVRRHLVHQLTIRLSATDNSRLTTPFAVALRRLS